MPFRPIAAALCFASLLGCGTGSQSQCSSSAALTSEEAYLAINEDVPGFGGLVLDQGAYLVWLTDLSQSAGAEVKISKHLTEFEKPTAPMRFRQGQFTWKALTGWRKTLNASAELSPLNTSMGTDAFTNRLTFGVRDLKFEPDVRRIAERLGVPRDAMVVKVQVAELASGNCRW